MGEERDREGRCSGIQGTEDLRVSRLESFYPLSAHAASHACYSRIVPYPQPGAQGTIRQLRPPRQTRLLAMLRSPKPVHAVETNSHPIPIHPPLTTHNFRAYFIPHPYNQSPSLPPPR